MEDLIHIHKTFEKVIYFGKALANREFDGCVFRNCDFSNSNFSSNTFIDCEFFDCNLGMTQLKGTGLKTVSFTNCKLLGVPFNECDGFLFNVTFEDCILDYASFENRKMPKTKFSGCSLRDTVYIGADLSASVFDNCNLEGAIFNDTQLKEADFSSAINYKIDPELNPMRKTKFSVQGIPGLLEKYDIKIL